MSRSPDPLLSSPSSPSTALTPPPARSALPRGVEIVSQDQADDRDAGLYRAGHGLLDQDQGIRVRWFWVGRPWATLLLLAAAAWSLVWLASSGVGAAALLLPTLVASAGAYYGLTQALNRTTVAVLSDTLVASHGPLPLRGTVLLGIDEVKSLDILTRRAQYTTHHVVIATLHSGEEWELLWCEDLEVAEVVVAQIRESMARRVKRPPAQLP
jgi:hypothetical protein